MTEEKLNRLEALAKAAKSGSLRDDDKLYMSSGPDTMLSLIALARVGLAVTKWAMPDTVSLSRAGGVEGPSIYLNDHRITGPKPWGGATSMEDFKPVKTRQIFTALGFPLSALPKPGGK